MAKIAITFVDQPDGLVDIQVYLEEVVEGADPTTAMQLAMLMMQSAKDDVASALAKTPPAH